MGVDKINYFFLILMSKRHFELIEKHVICYGDLKNTILSHVLKKQNLRKAKSYK